MNNFFSTGDKRKKAPRFILFFGPVSLFADLTYKGARSITGPFLKLPGAGVGSVAIGFGELIGYGLPFFSSGEHFL